MHNFHPASPIDCPEISEPIDIVYTWVNGSDPGFQKQLQKFKAKEEKQKVNSHVTERKLRHITAWQCTAKNIEMNFNGRF